MLNVQSRGLMRPGNRPTGAVLASILGQTNNGPSPSWPDGQRAPDEAARVSAFPDPSPPAFPPMNMPGGNSPAPINAAKPDYGALLLDALGQRPKMSTLQKIAGVVGPALMAASGDTSSASAMSANIWGQGREWDRRNQDALATAVKWRREEDEAQAKRNEPKFLSGNIDQVRYDPATGQATRVYDAPEDFEAYAAAQGLQPGSEDYFSAVEDYVLRGNGPTAFKYDRDLETVRNAARISLEQARQANRLGLRQTPTYRDTHPAPARPRASSGSPRETLPVVSSPAEAMKLPSGTKFKVKGSGQVKVRP